MHDTQSQIHQVEITIDEAKKQINKMNALIKLSNNKDYKEIFLEGYFKEFAVRQVLLKADPSRQNEGSQEDIIKAIDGIGSLRVHLQSIMIEGRQAEDALAEHQNTHEELLEEDAA